MLRDQKKSKINNCWNCILRKKGGINAFGSCLWWNEPKEIPSSIVDIGCKFWKDNYEQLELFK
jgi:hypothetical protein